MKSNILKIIVIDDNQQMHSTYHTYFKRYNEFDLKGIYTTIEGVLFDYDDVMPDIIISEVSLSKTSGIEGIRSFRKKDPHVKIIMVSEQNDFEVIKKAFKNGANGFLTKAISEERLYHALNSIKNEGAIIGNDIAKKVISMFQRKSYQSFSERENQIIDHLSQGATYKTIADKLFVTTSAINFHIQNIYLKLNVNSKSEALTKLQEIG